MARILLDDPAHAGGSSQLGVGSVANDGTGDPLRTGGQKLKTWAADLNTMTAELYASIAAINASLFKNNQVQFDGANDFLRRGANIFASDPKSVVIYADVTTPEKLDAYNGICGATTLLMLLSLDDSGQLVFSHTDAGVGLGFATASLLPSTHYRLALCIQCDTTDSAGDGRMKLWLSANGGTWSLEGSDNLSSNGDSTKLTVSGAAATNFTLFGHPTASAWQWGRVSDVTKVDGAPVGFFGLWASTSRTGAIITDPSIFYSGGNDRNMSLDLTLGGLLPAPLVAFGGTQVAADWNAGTNMGTAGAFTMFGGV